MHTTASPTLPPLAADMVEAARIEAEFRARLPLPTTIEEERALNRASAEHWVDGAPQMRESRELEVQGAVGPLRAQLHLPVERPGGLLLWLHGGGWVVGGIEQTEPAARSLAAESGWAVLSSTYRLAPEHRFPAALEDVLAVTRGLPELARASGVPEGRLAIGGASAGANLAAASVLAGGRVDACVLFYGVLGADLDTESYHRFDQAEFGLTRDGMARYFELYLESGANRQDPRVAPLRGDLAGFPRSFVAAASHDVLRDDSRGFAARLAAAGVETWYHEAQGLLHGYVNRTRSVAAARQAVAKAGRFLSAN